MMTKTMEELVTLGYFERISTPVGDKQIYALTQKGEIAAACLKRTHTTVEICADCQGFGWHDYPDKSVECTRCFGQGRIFNEI